ncbi:MAG TPA: hypothetical protein VLE91_00995 [Candidatus Saccharimonadales bacterium]|nr:hypothetical protein [Candidatus Saccharimonadales bacterium]
MKIKKILAGTAASALILASMTASTFAAPVSTAPGQNKIQCFDGTTDGGFGGTCTLNSKGAKGTATLALNSSNPNGDYAGVYTLESKLYSTSVTSLTQLSYQYSGTIVPSAGNLSYNIPIDTDGNGSTDFYLFVDAAHDGIHCPGVNGLVDIINDPNCVMYENGVTPRANWSAFVAANPDAKIANDNYAFIVAERTGSEPSAVWTVNNVKFGKGGK